MNKKNLDGNLAALEKYLDEIEDEDREVDDDYTRSRDEALAEDAWDARNED